MTEDAGVTLEDVLEAPTHERPAHLARLRHDLRTPLNAVLCFAQLLEIEDLEPRQREFVAHILDGARSLDALIGGLRAGDDATVESAPVVGRHHRVLYVEDNAMNFELVRQALARDDLELIAASTGAEGLDAAREHSPDLVLLDLNLPDMSGEDVLAELRATAASRATPVLVLTADATGARTERLLGLGAFAYMTKPLDLRRFRDHVRGALAARGSAG